MDINDLPKNILLDISSGEDKTKAIRTVFDILEENKLMTLATIDKDASPHVCNAFFVYDNEFNLYFWSETATRHSLNIKENDKVAVSIADTAQSFEGSLKGMQINGRARGLSIKELIGPGKLYFKRFPFVSTIIKRVSDFNLKKLESRLYKIEIDKIKLFERYFGKERYTEIKIKRK